MVVLEPRQHDFQLARANYVIDFGSKVDNDPNDKINSIDDIEMGEWSIKKFRKRVVVEGRAIIY